MRALVAVAIGAVSVVVVVSLLPGVAAGPTGAAAAGPETPVPMAPFGGLLLAALGMGLLLWRDR